MNQSALTANRATGQLRVVLGAVFLVYLAQMSLNPIIAPLSREVGLAEWQVGVTISVAAVMVVTTSGIWGRRSQSWGRRPVLITAFALAAVIMTAFLGISWLAMMGGVTALVTFAGFLLLRGIGFGTVMGAVAPTAQAYIADVAPDEQTRVKGMDGIGAAQGFAMVAGSLLGGLLSGLGLLVPLMVVPLLLILGLVLVAGGLRREGVNELIARPRRLSPWDRRIWPFLVTGFGMFTALGFIQILTGFVVQDRLGLAAGTTGVVTGAALLTSGAGMLTAQALIVPRSGWSPARLLQVGCAIAVVGFVLYIPDAGGVLLFAAMALIGLGLGIAMPGYVAGPTLLVGREEQGGLAGLTNGTSALTFVIAPTASSVLYQLWPPLPIIVATVILVGVTGFLFCHPRFRRGQPAIGSDASDPVQPERR